MPAGRSVGRARRYRLIRRRLPRGLIPSDARRRPKVSTQGAACTSRTSRPSSSRATSRGSSGTYRSTASRAWEVTSAAGSRTSWGSTRQASSRPCRSTASRRTARTRRTRGPCWPWRRASTRTPSRTRPRRRSRVSARRRRARGGTRSTIQVQVVRGVEELLPVAARHDRRRRPVARVLRGRALGTRAEGARRAVPRADERHRLRDERRRASLQRDRQRADGVAERAAPRRLGRLRDDHRGRQGGNQTSRCLQGAVSLCAAWAGRVPERAVGVLAKFGDIPTQRLVTAQADAARALYKKWASQGGGGPLALTCLGVGVGRRAGSRPPPMSRRGGSSAGNPPGPMSRRRRGRRRREDRPRGRRLGSAGTTPRRRGRRRSSAGTTPRRRGRRRRGSVRGDDAASARANRPRRRDPA